MYETDVLIVGGGLSGLSAAYHLKKNGVSRVTVIERMSGDAYGHYHRTCGEAVSERLFAASGVPRGCIVRDIRGMRITFGDTDIDIPVKGHIIDRERLLADLRDGADADIVNDSVIDVERISEGYLVTTREEQYRCRYLIGADGAFSLVRKRVFGHSPLDKVAVVNNIVETDSGPDLLCFEVSSKYPGMYRWDFPSKDGRRSIGYACGTDDIEDHIEQGIRFIATGRNGPVVKERCCLIGDAAVLTNPLCYGGIGAALISGRKAAECILKDDLTPYGRWVDHDRMFDHHFMEAQATFKGWSEEDFADAVRPFRKGYSLLRGGYAIIRRPKWANVYTSIWVAFRRCW